MLDPLPGLALSGRGGLDVHGSRDGDVVAGEGRGGVVLERGRLSRYCNMVDLHVVHAFDLGLELLLHLLLLSFNPYFLFRF